MVYDISVEFNLAPAFVATDADGDSVVLDNGVVVAVNNDVPEKVLHVKKNIDAGKLGGYS